MVESFSTTCSTEVNRISKGSEESDLDTSSLNVAYSNWACSVSLVNCLLGIKYKYCWWYYQSIQSETTLYQSITGSESIRNEWTRDVFLIQKLCQCKNRYTKFIVKNSM